MSSSSLHAHSFLLLHRPPNQLHHSLQMKSLPKTPSFSHKPPYNSRILAKDLEAPIELHDYRISDQDFNHSIEEQFTGHIDREESNEFDRDPEFADIIGTSLDDPDRAKSKMEERLRRKRNKILHTKTGSPTPMAVTFNKFEFSNSYIWLEFYNDLLENDVSLLCDTIRSWHIIGRLGGCNAMNMQLSQSPLDQRPSYDAIQGGNVTPTTFYNIGDLEIQDNVARIWVDIGTSEPLILDTLINALTQISTDYFGIKQVVFGGSGFEHWREDLTSEDAGYSIHKI